MPWWKYNIFKGEPKTLVELRLHQDNKCNEYYKTGKFWYTNAAADGKPVLLVSNKDNTDIKPKYIELAAPKTKGDFITGTYESGKDGDGYYAFKPDAAYFDGKDPGKKKVYDKIRGDKDLENDIRACIAMANPKVVSWEDSKKTVFGMTKRSKVEWVVAEFDVAKAVATPIGAGSTRRDGTSVKKELSGERFFKNGLVLSNGSPTFAKDFGNKSHEFTKIRTKGGIEGELGGGPIKVSVFGEVVDVAVKDKLLERFREGVTDVWVDCLEVYMDKVIKVDEALVAKKKAPADAEKELGKAYEELGKEFEEKAREAVGKQFFEVVRDDVDMKLDNFDAKVALAKSGVLVALSIAATATAPFAGPAAILGLVGLIKSGLELGRDFYQFKRGVEGLEKELGKDIARTYARYVLEGDGKKAKVGFEEFGKAFLEKLPGLGILVNDVIKAEGTKTADALDKNYKSYRPKVAEEFTKVQKQVTLIHEQLDAVTEEAKKVEVELKKQEATGGPEAKQKVKDYLKSRTDAEKVLDELLVKIAGKGAPGTKDYAKGAYGGFLERREKVDKFAEQIEKIKKSVPPEAKVVIAIVGPLMDFTWGGVDPANIASTVMNSGSATLDILTGVIGALEKDGTKTDAGKLLKVGNDYANQIRQIVANVKK